MHNSQSQGTLVPIQRVNIKVVPKPLIPIAKLPPEFNLKKRMQKNRSEEKFSLNDIIDFTKRNNTDEGLFVGLGENMNTFTRS